MKKKDIVSKWEKIAETSKYLWHGQALQNASIIKNNSAKKALEILMRDYKKYESMGIASFIQSAINDLIEFLVPNGCPECGGFSFHRR